MKQIKNFIANEFVEPRNGKYFPKTNPLTEETSLQVPQSDATDADAATTAAESALDSWSQTALQDRCEKLNLIASIIEKRTETFARAECEDTGKPIRLCRDLDIPRAVQNFNFFADFSRQSGESQIYEMPQAKSLAFRQPLGVVGLITPWNLPIYLLTWKLAPALAMGNTVVAKPSEFTPQTANLLAEVFLEAEIPRGVFNVIHGPGSYSAEPLLQSKRVKAISFTGGTHTGTRVAQLASQNFKKISLELGGKNPTLIFADADLDKAVKGVVRSSFLNQGQICLCGERILVQKSIYKDFVEKFVTEAQTLVPTDPQNENSNFGTLISKSHLEKVHASVERARRDGGKVLIGGERPNQKGYFYPPTIIEGLPSNAASAQEEIFGPVVTLHPFENEDEAIALANDVAYGLSASCWTENEDRALRLGKKIQAGTVWINTWLMRDLRVPFGGVKKSGLGREGGSYSLDFFSEMKTVCMMKKDVL